MKALIIIERGQDGTYSAYPAKLNTTIIGEGETAEAAKADFLNSYEEIKQYYLEVGEEMPVELKDLDFEYRYDLAAFFNSFDFINVSKFAKAVGVEPSLMRHYKIGDAGISTKQKRKIERGLHSLARELQNVTL